MQAVFRLIPNQRTLTFQHALAHFFAAMRREAMQALEYRSVMGGRKVFFFGNAVSPSEVRLVDDDFIKELGYLLRFRSEEECLSCLDRIRDTLEREGNGSYYYVLTGILNVLMKACNDLEGIYAQYGGHDVIYRRLFEIKTIR